MTEGPSTVAAVRPSVRSFEKTSTGRTCEAGSRTRCAPRRRGADAPGPREIRRGDARPVPAAPTGPREIRRRRDPSPPSRRRRSCSGRSTRRASPPPTRENRVVLEDRLELRFVLGLQEVFDRAVGERGEGRVVRGEPGRGSNFQSRGVAAIRRYIHVAARRRRDSCRSPRDDLYTRLFVRARRTRRGAADAARVLSDVVLHQNRRGRGGAASKPTKTGASAAAPRLSTQNGRFATKAHAPNTRLSFCHATRSHYTVNVPGASRTVSRSAASSAVTCGAGCFDFSRARVRPGDSRRCSLILFATSRRLPYESISPRRGPEWRSPASLSRWT